MQLLTKEQRDILAADVRALCEEKGYNALVTRMAIEAVPSLPMTYMIMKYSSKGQAAEVLIRTIIESTARVLQDVYDKHVAAEKREAEIKAMFDASQPPPQQLQLPMAHTSA